MAIIKTIFGEGKELAAYQMFFRAMVVFLVALMLIRLSGRRSFGQKTPFDNIVVITLGATLSRAIVGASGFAPIVCACTAIALAHRFFGWLVVHNGTVRKIFEGDKMLLFKDGSFQDDNMAKALLCKEDVMRGIRKAAQTDDLDKIERAYIERNGEISVVKK